MSRLLQKMATLQLRKMVPAVIGGSVLGFFLQYQATGSVTNTSVFIFTGTLLFGLSLFPLIAFLIILSEDRKAGRLEASKFIDIASVLFLAIFLVCPWWMYLSPMKEGPGTKMPIQLWVFLIDGLPAFLGFLWLIFRNLWGKEKDQLPQFFRLRLQYVIMFVFIFIPLFLMKRAGM